MIKAEESSATDYLTDVTDLKELGLTRKNWFKASPFEGEIKIRLYIASILFLPGRGSCKLSTINCQLNEASVARNRVFFTLIFDYSPQIR